MKDLRLICRSFVTISGLGLVVVGAAWSEPGPGTTAAIRVESSLKQARPAAETALRGREPGVCAALGGAGMVVHIDPSTGRRTARPAAKQSAAAVAALKVMANRSSAGLVEEFGPTGGVRVNLRGRFRAPAVARVGSDGMVIVEHIRCEPGAQPGDEMPAAGTNNNKEQ